MNENRISYILAFIPLLSFVICDIEVASGNERYKIEGKVFVPFVTDLEWIHSTKILVDGGRYLGILKYVMFVIVCQNGISFIFIVNFLK